MTDTIIKTIITFIVSGLCGFIASEINNKRKKDSTYNEAIKCLLRANMVNVYFTYKEIGEMPYYCKQSWYLMYEAYKGLGGNSFIDDIKKEIDGLEVQK